MIALRAIATVEKGGNVTLNQIVIQKFQSKSERSLVVSESVATVVLSIFGTIRFFLVS